MTPCGLFASEQTPHFWFISTHDTLTHTHTHTHTHTQEDQEWYDMVYKGGKQSFEDFVKTVKISTPAPAPAKAKKKAASPRKPPTSSTSSPQVSPRKGKSK